MHMCRPYVNALCVDKKVFQNLKKYLLFLYVFLGKIKERGLNLRRYIFSFLSHFQKRCSKSLFTLTSHNMVDKLKDRDFVQKMPHK